MQVTVTHHVHPDPDCITLRITVNGVTRNVVAKNAAARAALAKAKKLLP